MKVVCAAKNCKYSSENEDSTHVIFINFPNDDTSKIWAHHCGRTDLLMKSNEELHLNCYICSHHIEDHYYISKSDPVIINQHAVPTLFESDVLSKKDLRNILDRDEKTEVTNNVVLSYCDVDTEINQYRDISIRFPNLCRICGEPSLDGIEIFTEKGIELKLKDKISFHLPIVVDMEDLMPQKLCMNCYNKLEIAHSLVVTSLKTDMKLKRFLNINEEMNYDNKYNAIVKACSLDIAKEICSNEANQSTSIELSSDKVDEIVMNQDITTKLNYLENIDTQKTDFASNVRKEMQSELNNFIESYNKENKEDTSVNKTTNNPNNDATNNINKIACFHCKDSFKTQEIFKNHKMLCDEEEIIIQKQKEITSDINNEEEMAFHFVTKTCNICDKRFNDEKLFAEHEFSHCEHYQEKQCQIPDKLSITKEQQNIYEHSLAINPTATVETNKQCGHCESIYCIKKDLLNHIEKCHGGQLLFKCIKCNKSYEKWSSLDVHEATHRIDKPYLCDLCGKSFKHSNNLRGHKRTHLDDTRKKRHVCEICGNAFRSRFHLGEHMNQHNGNKPYSCEKCGKAFYKRIQLRQHKLSHGVNKHICPICGAAFNRKGNMNTHLKRHDNGDGIYTCSVCAYRCKSMSELKLHRKKHTEEDIIESIRKKCTDKTVWQCEVCSRIFSTRAVLLNHERIHKGEKMNVKCNICGKQLANKNSLIYHNKSIHSKERPHMCQYCGGAFVSKESRLIHERIHTGERPYICKICNMEYKCSSNLNQHMKIHSGIKPHRCTYCDKSFTRKGALRVHERIHTGEKPFSCDTCGKMFSQKNDMLKHTKMHKVKTMRCEQCDEVFTKRKDILKHVALHEQENPIVQEYVEVRQHIQPYNVNITCSEFE
ncbi:uncharacterized protein LOC143350063 isoform X1 [Colletes latitarsis]|uniref:uncharacterized protein LOC143350063 isoform X1 n=2 Tax=Colletes latitarsis TaxID=2605962 RepID=UPI0040352B32